MNPGQRDQLDAALARYLGDALNGTGPIDLRWAAHWTVGRAWGFDNWWTPPLPAVDDLVDAFLEDVGFRALQLGTVLSEPDVELISAVVLRLLPTPYRQETQLVIEALKLAAKRQHEARARRAVGVALVATAVVALFAL
jgi:hypothetical protein